MPLGPTLLKSTPPPRCNQANKSARTRHQKQALTFMMRRELSWNFDNKGRDIWEAQDLPQGLR